MKNYTLAVCLVAIILDYCFCPFATFSATYKYEALTVEDVEELDEDDENGDTTTTLLLRKKNKKGKKKPVSPSIDTVQPSAPPKQNERQEPPPCVPPCVIQDPVLGDEVCNNDCPQGSGWHCQGRHDFSTHALYAVCVPD